jgi:hypothetical protein
VRCSGRSSLAAAFRQKRLFSCSAPISPIGGPPDRPRVCCQSAKCLLAGTYRSKDSRRQGIAKVVTVICEAGECEFRPLFALLFIRECKISSSRRFNRLIHRHTKPTGIPVLHCPAVERKHEFTLAKTNITVKFASMGRTRASVRLMRRTLLKECIKDANASCYAIALAEHDDPRPLVPRPSPNEKFNMGSQAKIWSRMPPSTTARTCGNRSRDGNGTLDVCRRVPSIEQNPKPERHDYATNPSRKKPQRRYHFASQNGRPKPSDAAQPSAISGGLRAGRTAFHAFLDQGIHTSWETLRQKRFWMRSTARCLRVLRRLANPPRAD